MSLPCGDATFLAQSQRERNDVASDRVNSMLFLKGAEHKNILASLHSGANRKKQANGPISRLYMGYDGCYVKNFVSEEVDGSIQKRKKRKHKRKNLLHRRKRRNPRKKILKKRRQEIFVPRL